MRNFHLMSLSFSSPWVQTAFKLNESYTKHYVHENRLSTGFHNVPWYTQSHFLDGVNLTGGIPLVLWVDCLGVVGTTGSVLSLLLLEVVDAPVELVGICPCSVGVALLINDGRTGLTIGKAGISRVWRFEGCCNLAGICPLLFLSLPSASNSK